MSKLYKILKEGKIIKSPKKGLYAANAPGKIFGTLDCKSGKRMYEENRRFFHNLEDAVNEGYRPCMSCKPLDEKDFKKIKKMIPYKTLYDFYNRDKRK